MDEALGWLGTLAALPEGRRFLLGPALAGGRVLVGTADVDELVPSGDGAAPWTRLLAPSPHGRVVVLGYELGRSILRGPARAAEDLALPRAASLRIERARAFDPADRGGAVAALTAAGGRAGASLGRAAHREAVAAIRAYLEAGDAYQANLTSRLEAPCRGSALALFASLADPLPSCAAYVELPGGVSIASASPELLLAYDARTRRAVSAPIKGTRPRGRDAAHDDALAAELAADEKERAEHVMIVDLVRNDLGRVAAAGTVRVPAPFAVHRLPGILHLVSEVEATLAPGSTLPALVASLFPAGSITGAPKLRSMEIIDELEPVARGPYCGSVGLAGADGSCALSVAIRTAVVREGRAFYGAGGGITVGSDPDREWEELVLKAARFLRAAGVDAPA